MFTLRESKVRKILSTLSIHDIETYEHICRVVIFSMLVSQKLQLCKEEEAALLLGAQLHDIGKSKIPKAILMKKEVLSPIERKYVEKHVAYGSTLAHELGYAGEEQQVILHHHEKWDGSGYPRGRKKEQIPMFAQIFSIVDSFDAMTSVRPYQSSITIDEAKQEIIKLSGSHFSPYFSKIFTSIPNEELEKTIHCFQEPIHR